VDRAKELMTASYADALSLTTIAREVGMSTFHFARVFRELEGEPRTGSWSPCV
jgi:AraC-like DNA-binding protein